MSVHLVLSAGSDGTRLLRSSLSHLHAQVEWQSGRPRDGVFQLSVEAPVGFQTLRKRNVMSESQKQPRVFVVDDEDVIASTLAMILRSQGGFNARSFTKPHDALDAARLDPPDLLISDVVMPQLSGIELAIQVREHCPDCKVLLFSGQAATFNLLETARTNGYDFDLLEKPVHPSDLLARIRNLTESIPSPPTLQARR